MKPFETDLDMLENRSEHAIVLVDPVSSGKHLKSYVHSLGYRLVAVFTLTQEQLIASGKSLSNEEKYRYCDQILESNQIDSIEDWLDGLPYQIVAIVGASEPAVELADALARRFGVRGNDPLTSFLRRNKYEARLAVQNAGLSGPEFRKCTSSDDLLNFIEGHSFPIVLKTPEGAGAHHVFVCHNPAQAMSAHKTIMTEPNLFGKRAPYSLAEEYIHGSQFVVELFAVDGKMHLTSLWEFEFGDAKDGKIEFERARLITDESKMETLSNLVAYAKSVAQTLDVRWGPCLVELRNHSTRGAQLIEMGARLSGIELPVILREVSNFDPFLETLKIFIGKDAISHRDIEYKKCAALIFVKTYQGGVVRTIQGVQEIQSLPSYFMNLLTIQTGSRVSPSCDLASIPLYVYLIHEKSDFVEKDEVLVREHFQVELDHGPLSLDRDLLSENDMPALSE
jgi:biotin carboxylase